LAAHTDDDGFREIQLDTKQLVFLFMAATVVSVVIFLCGVLVGRGVRAERGAPVPDTASSVAEVTPQEAPQAPAPPPAGADPTKAAPPQPVDDLSYFSRLEKSNAADEHVQSQSKRDAGTHAKEQPSPPPPPVKERPNPPLVAKGPAAAPVAPVGKDAKEVKEAAAPSAKDVPKDVSKDVKDVKEQPARETAAKDPVPVAATTNGAAHGEPAGTGYALQVAALRERREAQSIADRLSSKGYGAYVLTPASGTPAVFRVRVGKFKTRREAEAVASKLAKEERVNPWITH